MNVSERDLISEKFSWKNIEKQKSYSLAKKKLTDFQHFATHLRSDNEIYNMNKQTKIEMTFEIDQIYNIILWRTMKTTQLNHDF